MLSYRHQTLAIVNPYFDCKYLNDYSNDILQKSRQKICIKNWVRIKIIIYFNILKRMEYTIDLQRGTNVFLRYLFKFICDSNLLSISDNFIFL